jgi:hypothetical protein
MDAQWVSAIIALAALALAAVALILERVDRRKSNRRIIDLETARDAREAEHATRERNALLAASPRIDSAVMSLAPRVSTGYTLRLVNRGAATASDLIVGADLAGLEGAVVASDPDKAGDATESFSRISGYDSPDVSSLPAGESVEVHFWYEEVRDRVRFRVAWTDGLGAHAADQDVTVRRPGD